MRNDTGNGVNPDEIRKRLRELIAKHEKLDQAQRLFESRPGDRLDAIIASLEVGLTSLLPSEAAELERQYKRYMREFPNIAHIVPRSPGAPPPGQMMDWLAKACFKSKYESVFEPLITDYRLEVQKARDAGYSKFNMAKLHGAYWLGFWKACGVFAVLERVTKYFTST